MSDATWIAFLVAAAIGAPARYLIDRRVQDRTDGVFPWGTFVVNISGCVFLGLLTGAGLYHGLGATARTVVGTGGCGAYTTFSTFTYETVTLAEEGAINEAFRNAAANFVIGLTAASAGLAFMSVI